MYFGLKVDMATNLLILSARRACTAINIVGGREQEWPHSLRPEAEHFVLHPVFGRELRQASVRACGGNLPVRFGSAEDAARAAMDSENACRIAAGREELLSSAV
jgi:hypothetical protein